MENLVADRTELRAGRRLDFNQELAREGRTNPSKRIVIAFVEDVDAIGNEADFQFSRQAAAEVTAVRRTTDEDDARCVFFDQSGNRFVYKAES